MGWSSGTDVAIGIINAVKKNVRDELTRQKIYKGVITTLEDSDWDCQGEAIGIDRAFDKALKKIHPDWGED